MKRYLTEVRTDLSELKILYGFDFFEENALRFMTAILKLSVNLRREIIHRVGNNYSSLKQILNDYITIGQIILPFIQKMAVEIVEFCCLLLY